MRQHAARVELALRNLQDLEYVRMLPATPTPTPGGGAAAVALSDGSGKLLYRLEENGKKAGKELEMRVQTGDKTAGAVISAKDYDYWQAEMERLTIPPKQ